MHTGEDVAIAKLDGSMHKTKITKLFSFSGLKRTDITETVLGDIIAVAGVEGITIGETITDALNPAPLPPIMIDEPTIAMTVHGEHFAVRGTRRDLRHFAQSAGASGERAAHQCLFASGGNGHHRFLQSAGARRTAAFDHHRDDAARGLRADGGQTRDRHQAH